MPDIKTTMDEWKHGELHSGSKTGPVVTSHKQAVAIALSEHAKAHAGSHYTYPTHPESK